MKRLQHLLLNIFVYGLKIKWFIFRPAAMGTGLLLVSNNKVLLTQNSYRKGWYFPSGGVKKGELIKKALVREVKEEVGIVVKEDMLEFLAAYQFRVNHKHNLYIIFSCTADLINDSDIKIDELEVINAKFFKFQSIPSSTNKAEKTAIDDYIKGKKGIFSDF